MVYQSKTDTKTTLNWMVRHLNINYHILFVGIMKEMCVRSGQSIEFDFNPNK